MYRKECSKRDNSRTQTWMIAGPGGISIAEDAFTLAFVSKIRTLLESWQGGFLHTWNSFSEAVWGSFVLLLKVHWGAI